MREARLTLICRESGAAWAVLHGRPMKRSQCIWAAVVAAIAGGCLDRPVVSRSPTTNTTFVKSIYSQQIDKVDLLLVIDNSASMGDKQQYLGQAVPALITRLVTPNCVDPSGAVYGPSDSQGNGTCARGTVEFPPVHDMHIGVLSTSLGARLSDQFGSGSSKGQGTICDPAATLMLNGVAISNHNDDRAELLNRAGLAETPLADAGTSFYLNWFPASNPKNQGKTPSPGAPPLSSPSQLIADFTSLIQGVGNYGCGIESQLESWYRFLVQPDPYDSLTVDGSGRAQWTGVDAALLKQRHDFLRPDSLVAIVDLTDENDSEIDVRSFGGSAWGFMAQNFDPLRGTTACAEKADGSGLVDPGVCTSCAFSSAPQSDPDCMLPPFGAANDWGYNPNLRHVHMTQKYGAVPQFPIQRYVLGLTSTTVPDRNGEYPAGASSYQGLTNRDCVNPLFAASLPDGTTTDPAVLCKLPAGGRTADLVYYAHIGGVPHQLLQKDPSNPDSPQKDTLADADWTKILGKDPLSEDYTGIDPHMIESYQPRAGLPVGPTSTPDPASGYDWTTDQGAQHVLQVDREYACTFPLTTPRDCTDTTDPSVLYACDCPATAGLTPDQLPPLCNPSTPTQQVAAKAYPTTRELLLAKLMGARGFISSLCPIHVQPAAGQSSLTDGLFGYNPAVNGIVDRLKVALGNECIPETLTTDPGTGLAPCLILVSLPAAGAAGSCANPGSACDPREGLVGPDVASTTQPAGAPAPLSSAVLQKYCETAEAAYVAGGGAPGGKDDPDVHATCALDQITTQLNAGDFSAGTCASAKDPGWCYVTGAPAVALRCPAGTIVFTAGAPPAGARTSLECLESSVNVVDGG